MSKNITKCKSCEKEVAITAKTCPHCGQKSPGISNGKGSLVTFGIILIVSVFISLIKNTWIFLKEKSTKILMLTVIVGIISGLLGFLGIFKQPVQQLDVEQSIARNKQEAGTAHNKSDLSFIISQPFWGRTRSATVLSDRQLAQIRADEQALKDKRAAETNIFGTTKNSVIGAAASHFKSILDMFNSQEFAPDPDFAPSADFIGEIREQYGIHDVEPLGDSTSLAHLHAIASRIQDEEKLLKTIMSNGTATGIMAMIAVSVLGLVALWVSFLTVRFILRKLQGLVE